MNNIINYLEQFKKDFIKRVEKDTWDKGLPKIYMDEKGNIIKHWKDGKIEIIKEKKENGSN